MKSIIHHVKRVALGSIPLFVILVFWLVFRYYNQDLRWLIPSPTTVASSFWELLMSGEFLRLISKSLFNLIPPLILAAVLALILGTLMGLNRSVRRIFLPFLSAVYAIPSLAWLPFIILIFGFTRESIWVIIFISSFTKIVYNVMGGIRTVNANYVLAAKNFEFSKFKIIFNVILPCAFPQILTGLRIGYGSAWKSLIGAEMLVNSLGGLGEFIWMSQWFFDFDKVIAGIVVIALISILTEEIVFKRLEKHTLKKWGMMREDYN
ncbi:MAG: ABC transporter permease [Nanoarchaeota archaeon]|nr:ABC transporter permease [Nanoarchaeota archaeon]